MAQWSPGSRKTVAEGPDLRESMTTAMLSLKLLDFCSMAVNHAVGVIQFE